MTVELNSAEVPFYVSFTTPGFCLEISFFWITVQFKSRENEIKAPILRLSETTDCCQRLLSDAGMGGDDGFQKYHGSVLWNKCKIISP